MTRINLRIYVAPGQAEVFISIKAKDGSYLRESGIVDTGAQVSLLSKDLMDVLDYRLSERGQVIIDQAGIAKQAFHATEAFVKVIFEDMSGSRTPEYEIRVWFAETDTALVGFDGVLDRVVLHIDMPERTGYLEFP